MSSTAFFSLLLLVWLMLYVLAPIWLLTRGCFVRAGLAQLLGAVVPGF